MTIFNSADVSWGFQAVRSSYCVNGDCLVASVGPGRVVKVRDSKDQDTEQEWEPWEWTDLLEALVRPTPADGVWYRLDWVELGLERHQDPPVLRFTYDEWDAFVDGVRDGEFDYLRLCSPAPRGPVAGRTAATGAVESSPTPAPVAAALGSAPVVTGMNAAGYAAMNVPAGRDLRDESTPVGSLDAVATTGQPGLEISDEAVEAAAIRLKVNAECHGAFTTLHTMRQWARAALTAALPLLGPPAPAWGSGPLVKFDLPDTSHAAVDMGWASPDGLVNEAGEVGPAHPRLGPTEPADCEQARA